MPRGSEELTSARKEEFVRACASLYESMSFKDITIKEIGAITGKAGLAAEADVHEPL